MSIITIKKTDITSLDTDAVVNAANDGLWAGGGVCGAIFKAAGLDKLQAACNKIGHCDTGSAVITNGFDLKAKFIIHAVGPVWKDGKHNESKLLYSAYIRSLDLAAENGCKSIGFPLISAGIFGYPLEQAWRKAIQACNDFLNKNPDTDMEIVFAVLNDSIYKAGQEALAEIAPMYKIAVRSDWKTFDLPSETDEFYLDRQFTAEQMSVLRKGNIPKEMEDKWFWYMDGNTLYAHRSWTGFCIYKVEFSEDGHHQVTVNRNDKQYKCKSIDEDRTTLSGLLDWWEKPHYDYYNEWLSETVDAINKAKESGDQIHINGQTFNAVFFHKPDESNGYLSNWYHSEFDLDGKHFTSTEQYIMYRKCKMFGDDVSANAVLATDDVAKQQDIGRHASGYIDVVWAGARQIEALNGLYAKFSQNKKLGEELIATGDAYLVECAYHDKIWACGITLDDDNRFYADKWKGKNILGFALMQVRAMLLQNHAF